ncbi:hypothetical protein OM427_12125 [Halomonas sp. 18H]|nr:hypothetical protein [Halomonas sp. 18H]MCW4150270.1 hypothetical protein [Halomonas sp. 18H]
MKKKYGLALFCLGASFGLTGCATLENATQNYLASANSQAAPIDVEPVELYDHPEYGRSVRFSSLPLDQAIVRVQGSGEHKMAVMMDPACPYSRQLEGRLTELNDTTVYIFVGPFLRNSPVDLALQQVCQANNQSRLSAYESVMVNQQYPPKTNISASCRTNSISVFNSLLDIHNDFRSHERASKTGLPLAVLENDITYMGTSIDSIRKYQELDN